MSGGQLLRGVSHATYHNDQVDEWLIDPEDERTGPGVPRLSRSIATKLLNESPLHAWGAHPKLGGRPQGDDNAATDGGSLYHGLLLGHAAEVAVCMIPAQDSKGKAREPSPAWGLESALTASLRGTGLIPAKDWLTRDAQLFRAESRAHGRLPVLLHDLAEAQAILPALCEQLDEVTDGALADCETEVTALWDQGGVACKARLDGLSLRRGLILDLKFLADAHPGAFGRSMRANGYDIQHAASRAAIEAIHSELAGRLDFQFVCVEVNSRTRVPVQIGGRFLISTPNVGRTKADVGERRWARAIGEWARLLETYGNSPWPSYDCSVAIEAATYEQQDELEYQLRQEEPDWVKGAGS